MKRLILFLWVLTIDKRDLANIIAALAKRQPNGRSNTKPYEDAERLSEEIPFRKDLISAE